MIFFWFKWVPEAIMLDILRAINDAVSEFDKSNLQFLTNAGSNTTMKT